MDALSQMNVVDYRASLAADLAADLYDQETVFRNHGLSLEAGKALLAQPWFEAMVAQARRDWGALDNVRDRIRTKAQIALEDSIPTVYGLIHDKTTPGAARVAAFKEMKEIAGMGAKEEGSGGPAFIPIQIFLDGSASAPVTIRPQRDYPGGNAEDAELGDEEDAGAIPDPVLVARAARHAAQAGDEEPCFVLGMEQL